MRRVALATALIAASLIGGTVAANAEEFGFSVGVGDHDAYWRDDHRWRGDYAYASGCRTVITHRMNDDGDRVTVRKRICD